MKSEKTHVPYHHNVDVQLGGVMKDLCEEDGHIHQHEEKLIYSLCKMLYSCVNVTPSLSVLSVNQCHFQNDLDFSI